MILIKYYTGLTNVSDIVSSQICLITHGNKSNEVQIFQVYLQPFIIIDNINIIIENKDFE